ncbi:hypothetical protein BTVI_84807 [Pitangus sulphuratus]|nr:hypothetical protein BTVI_84807 [Pitangus sulphuratus]
MGCQLFQEYAMGDGVKGFTEAQIDHIHSLPLIHLAGHLIIKGDQLPIIWDLPSDPELLVNDGERLGELFRQLPHHPRMDPIWSHRLVRIQTPELRHLVTFEMTWGSQDMLTSLADITQDLRATKALLMQDLKGSMMS